MNSSCDTVLQFLHISVRPPMHTIFHKIPRKKIQGSKFCSSDGRGDLVARSRSRDRRVAGSKPDSTEVRRVWGLLHVKSYVVVKCPPAGVVRKFGEGVSAQVSSSSSDRGSKLRAQNSPRVASKRDVNIT
ncbi:hypothetical protein AVEN_179009-1 [Araneus ventricosus]|uniref:Uncharacterized protein n=1 Tax=Araneus ventricosus TaxID=182803 RepID=A0A4Y2H915_ARAVE|nr:hypothetical protein AVEN_179009-1 [Araneus ventricosus]